MCSVGMPIRAKEICDRFTLVCHNKSSQHITTSRLYHYIKMVLKTVMCISPRGQNLLKFGSM